MAIKYLCGEESIENKVSSLLSSENDMESKDISKEYSAKI